MYSDQVTTCIHQALDELQLPKVSFVVEHPQIESHGDYAANIAMVLYPILKKEGNNTYPNPRALADAIVSKINDQTTQLSSYQTISVAGPGFINFSLQPSVFISELEAIRSEKDNYGKSDAHKNKNIIVEYSSPNIAKPFTIGHLRSTIIGDAIANLKAATGWNVFRDNHLGDWGTQFGKQIYAIKAWGNETDIDNAVEPVKLLVDLYVKFHQEAELKPEIEDEARLWFKKLEDGDGEARRLWKKCIDWSWKEFASIYQELGIVHTENGGRGYGESYFEDKMGPVIDQLKQTNLLKEGKEGAQIVEFEGTKLPPLMILKKDGATLYATRDLAADLFRKQKYGDDITIINEVGAEQSLYFQQLYSIEVMLGWFKSEQRIHVGHGLYRFKDVKMSTRKGNVIWLKDVIEEAKKRSTSSEIAIGAIKYNDLKRKPLSDVVFDWDELLNMEGNSGPYLQYTYARCSSVLAKATNFTESESLYQPNESELTVAKWLARFPETVTDAATNLAPHMLCEYAYELAQRYNSFYNHYSILGNPEKPVDQSIKQFRILLTAATRQVLKNTLSVLGIQCPEHM